MHDVGTNDFYEVSKKDTFGGDDILKVRDFYLPLIGAKSFALYSFLLGEENGKIFTHERIFLFLSLTPGELYNAFLPLEALGLIKTMFEEGDKGNYFVYCLYPPVNPSSFLSDPMLGGLLKNTIGNANYSILESKYNELSKLDGFKDVSESYDSYFAFGNSSPFLNAKKKKSRIKTDFDYSKLEDSLLSLGFNNKSLNENDKILIGKYASLYGLNPEEMADIVLASYFNGSINFKRLEEKCRAMVNFSYLQMTKNEKSQVSSSSSLAKKIKFMDETDPTHFLSLLQGGNRPSYQDLRLLQHLKIDTGLSNPLINVLIDYVLAKKNGVLPFAYTENLGVILLRKGAKSSRDAMSILLEIDEENSKKKKQTNKQIEEIKPVKESKVKEEKEEDVSGEEIDALMKTLE